MLSKVDFKYVFMTMISGAFWVNLYKLLKNDTFSLTLMFSVVLGFISLVGILRLITMKDIDKMIYNIKKNKKT